MGVQTVAESDRMGMLEDGSGDVVSAPLPGTSRKDLPMLPHSIPPLDLAYMAGLFDGEGSISIVKRRYARTARTTRIYSGFSLRIALGNTSREACETFARAFGGGVHLDHQHGQKVRPVYRWTLADAKAGAALAVLAPVLKIKAQQAKVALVFRVCQSTTNAHRGNKCMSDEDRELQTRMAAAVYALNRGIGIQSEAGLDYLAGYEGASVVEVTVEILSE